MNVPVPHCVHEFEPKLPANVPAGQLVHVAAETVSEKDPGGHLVQR
jgi:hypothetical protein